ncbi:MAG: type II toxin-antitoxin system VapC family toxin [Roseiarcus sp.]|jgi:predicted nucleic acid-binding protein
MYLVDTNVVSEARRNAPQAVAWLRAASPSSIYLSVITLGEIMKGIALKERSDRQAAGHLAEWLLKLRQEFADRILPVSDAVAIEWGRIAALRPRGDSDGLIAATAKVHDLILVTRNVADFDDTSLSIVNPWAPGE